MRSLLQQVTEHFEGPVAVISRSGAVLASNFGCLPSQSAADTQRDRLCLLRFPLESLPVLDCTKELLDGFHCLRGATSIHRVTGDFAHVFGSPLPLKEDFVSSVLALVHPADRLTVMQRMDAIEESGWCDFQYRLQPPTGKTAWVRSIVLRLKDENSGEFWLASWTYTLGAGCVPATFPLISCTQTDSRREGTARLANMPLFRQKIRDRLNHWMSGKRPELFAVLIVNLIRFRAVNESLGHEAGDRILRLATQRLRSKLGARDVLAGLGGDEFAILLDFSRSPEDCAARVRNILAVIEMPVSVNGVEFRIQARAGLAFPRNLQSTVDSLLRDADAALESCRRQRERVVVCSEHSASRSSRQLVLELDLRLAIERNEFYFLYQPVIDARSGQIRMLEALLRWRHPRLGLISPASFLQLAEDSGLVLQLDLQGLERVTRQIGDWRTEIPELSAVPVTLNLSGRHFPHFAAQTLMQDMVDPRLLGGCRVAFELTETVFIEGAPEVVASLQKFRERGVEIWLDDFGIGYSSMQYLALFPVSGLKVPEFFVQSCLDGEKSTILQTFQSLAKGLNLGLVAEGVETAEQAAKLERLGFDWLQGFHFAKPQSAAEIVNLFAQQRVSDPTLQRPNKQSSNKQSPNKQSSHLAAEALQLSKLV